MLEPLRHFTLVAQHGTFTAAARHATVTQPALTASIQRLESQMGARLFVRGPGGATLTAAGEALLPRARAALAAVEEGKRAVAEIAGLAAGTVRIGGGATVCSSYLPRTLARFRTKHPNVQILLREGTPQPLLDALEAGELDILVMPRPRGGKHAAETDPLRGLRGGLVRERWLDDELILVRSPDLDPKGAPLVTFPKGTNTRAVVDARFPDMPIAMELGSLASVNANARAGVGIALVSRRYAQRDLTAGALVEIETERTPILRSLYLVHRGKERLPPAAQALHAMLREQARAKA